MWQLAQAANRDLFEHFVQSLWVQLAAADAIGISRFAGAVVRHIEIDPGQDTTDARVIHVDAGATVVVSVPRQDDIRQLASRRAPGFWIDLQDVPFLTVVGGNPVHVRAAASALIFTGEHVVGDVEKVGLAASQVDALRCIERVVAVGAVAIEYRLDDPCVVESATAPLGRLDIMRWAASGRRRLYQRRLAAVFVAADAALRFAWHQVREAAQCESTARAAFVECHERDIDACRHSEMSRSIRLDRHVAQHILGSIRRSARNHRELKSEGPQALDRTRTVFCISRTTRIAFTSPRTICGSSPW